MENVSYTASPFIVAIIQDVKKIKFVTSVVEVPLPVRNQAVKLIAIVAKFLARKTEVVVSRPLLFVAMVLVKMQALLC